MSERGNNLIDPAASLLAKHKRGRPRKYDAPRCEPRRRLEQPQVISSQSYPTIRPGSKLYEMLRLRSQVGSSVYNSSVGSTSIIQSRSYQANIACISQMFRPQQNEISLHEPHSLVGQTFFGVIESKFDLGYAVSVQIEGRIFKGILYDPQNFPQQPAVGNIASELSLCSAIDKEASQLQSDQIGNLTGTSTLDKCNISLIEESPKDTVEAHEKSQDLKRAKICIMEPQGDHQAESSVNVKREVDQDPDMGKVLPSPGQTPDASI